MAAVCTQHYYEQMLLGNVDLSATVNVWLANDGYTFDPATDSTETDINANKLPETNGYSSSVLQNGAMSGTTTKTYSWDDVQWTATGGSIGPTAGAWLIATASADNTVIGFVDAPGAPDNEATDGNNFSVKNMSVSAGP